MTAPPSAVKTILTSKWDGLSDHLVAKFYEVERLQGSDGKLKYQAKSGSVEVWAPLTDANFEATLSWNSPFENIGSNTSFPTLQAMLQSGILTPSLEQAKSGSGGVGDKALQASADFVQKFEGRTGITKLNSTQVFVGMAPVKIPVTALFRAWSDPAKEVTAPFDQLMDWALPRYLSPDGSVISRALAAARGKASGMDVLYPSVAPTIIGMRYKGSSFFPLVIESIAKPLSSPVYRDGGSHTELQVPMVLASLTAIDREDWKGWSIRR